MRTPGTPWWVVLWLRLLALLVPRRGRAAWLEEWLGELEARAREADLVRAVGALVDAVHLRREEVVRMTGVGGDVRHAVRGLVRRPGFTVVTVGTLALGIGANTAIFSVVRDVLLRPLPYESPERLVRLVGVREGGGSGDLGTVSYPNALDMAVGTGVFEGVSAFDEWQPALSSVEGGTIPFGATVNADFFDLLGVSPEAGRFFAPDEEGPGRERTVVVSHGLWTRRFGGDPGLVGRQIRLDGSPYTVVGVLGPEFEDPLLQGTSWGSPDAWRTVWFAADEQGRSARSWTALGRLRPDVTLEAAQAEVDAAFARLVEAFPEENHGRGIRLVPLRESMVGDVRPALMLLTGAVGLVLLMACVNVANLLLARGSARSGELALRRALGASRPRLVAQMALESLTLALAGGFAGLILAVGATGGLVSLAGRWLPRAPAPSLDGGLLLFTAVLSVGTALLFGTGPSLRAVTRAGAAFRPGDTGRGTSGAGNGSMRRGLVVAELALAGTLLVGAGLVLRSLERLHAVDLGLDLENVLTVEIHSSAFWDLPDGPGPKLEALADALGALPGVTAAGGIDIVPLGGSFSCDGVRRDDRPPPEPGEGRCAEVRLVVPGTLEVLGAGIVRGRALRRRDDGAATRVAVVSESAVRAFWDGGDPVGSTVTVHGESFRIVGVVADMREAGPATRPSPMLFMPASQDPWRAVEGRGVTLVARSRGSPSDLGAAVRDALRGVDGALPIGAVRSLVELRGDSVAGPRFRALLLGSLTVLALVLALVGIAAVMAYWVGRRRREIGIRVAVGAGAGTITRMVLREGLRMTIVGTAAGLAGGLIMSGLLESFLFGVGPRDPWVLAGVPMVLSTVALVACAVPAARAARVDPLEALRTD